MVTPPAGSEDARFLDELFDRVLRAWSEGLELPLAGLVADRPDLHEAIREVLADAREIALLRPRSAPQIPGYQLSRELGRGSMGVVYLARQEALGREVALKVLPTAAGMSAIVRQRFLTEARALARLQHASLVTVHEVIAVGDVVAFAMEWIRGASLAQELARRGPMDPSAACRMAVQVARGLAAAHQGGLVHRDVKPSNILLREDGTALLSDFGLVHDDAASTLTRSGAFVGTQAYAAPEQLRGDRAAVGPATDVYALGATLFHVLTGRLPFAPATVLARLRAAERVPVLRAVRRELPVDLETIVGKCLAPDHEQRYATANELADDLERLLALRPIRARPPGPVVRLARFGRRHRRGIVVVAATGLVVALGVVAAAWGLWRASTRPARVAAAVHTARVALLEPRHEDRMLSHLRGGHSAPSDRFAERTTAAIAAYDAALTVDPDADDVRFEREVVAAVSAHVAGRAVSVPESLRRAGPGAAAALQALADDRAARDRLPADLSTQDRFAAGLVGFLAGDVELCDAAWRPLGPTGDEETDAFVDAARGQMWLAQGRCDLAWPRLALARRAFPEAGFLAVAVADCAARLGDLDQARRALDASRGLSLPDPFDGAERVEADLLALDGHYDEAFARYRWLLTRRRGEAVRSRWVEMLARRGRPADHRLAIDLLAWLVEHQPMEEGYAHRFAAGIDAWSEVATADELADELCAPLCAADPDSHWVGRAIAAFDRHGVGAPAPGPLVRALSDEASALRELLAGLCSDFDARAGLPRWVKLAAVQMCAIADRCEPKERRLLGAAVRWVVTPGLRAWGRLARGWKQRRQSVWEWRCVERLSAGLPSVGAAVYVPGLGTVAAKAGPGEDVHLTVYDRGGRRELPSLRWLAMPALVHDPHRGLLVTGVAEGGNGVDVWSWEDGGWHVMHASTGPSARSDVLVAFDEFRNRLVLFGGHEIGDLRRELTDTWEWDGHAWKKIETPHTPPPRFAAAFTYDPAHRCVLLFGGIDRTREFSDTWTFDGVDWRRHRTTVAPAGRAYGAFGVDRLRHIVLLFGGHTAFNGDKQLRYLDDPWMWDGTSWSPVRLAPTSPRPPRSRAVFGKATGPSTRRVYVRERGALRSEAWDLVRVADR